jgi:hypothetical protein
MTSDSPIISRRSKLHEADETPFSKELFLIALERLWSLTSKSDSACQELAVITRFQEPSLVDTSALALAHRRGKMYADLPIFTYQRFDRESRPFCDVAPYKEAVPCEAKAKPPLPCEFNDGK